MKPAAAAAGRVACRARITGLVQGVGFRPFVHRLAVRHGLDGWVRNASGDVEISLEGEPAAVDGFLAALRTEAPALARIETVTREERPPRGTRPFRIRSSIAMPDGQLTVSPDVAICAACEAELFDPANRRHRHPFITCTDCGPRFTIIDRLPYDRERTSMSGFGQCSACLDEYHDPASRRHHSQTNSCPRCGPQLWFSDGGVGRSDGTEPSLRDAAALILAGGILAVRGLGGFHLAVDATSARAVARLRSRKRRDAKPLAIMVRQLEDARLVAEIGDAEAGLLVSPERPIVLLRLHRVGALAEALAPGLVHLGVMLAYTPLHHLLLEAVGRPLVMTSGNFSDEPIATGNAEAVDRLATIADGFLLHDREILARYDDSVMRVVRSRPVMLRRARGHAPMPLRLPVPSPVPLLAVGADLKNTFTLVQGDQAYLSQHIGDLESIEALDHFRDSLARCRALFRIEPAAVAHDRHAGYLSTRLARESGLPRALAVQHHHAHVAAVLAEHGETGPVLGVAFDGTGAGSDGTTWGAEFLVADLIGYRRVGHLVAAPMPGGDIAARTPWRAALGYLSLHPRFAPAFALAFDGVDPAERRLAERQVEQSLNAPRASSMGRLFDAAAAVLGVRRESSYEGQAAMELEALAGTRSARQCRSRLVDRNGCLVIDPVSVLADLGRRRQRGADVADLAADFHASVVWATVAAVLRLAAAEGLATVALCGGSFQNTRLLESLVDRLTSQGLRVIVPCRLPANDGAISYGQAAVAAATLAAEREG